MSTRTRFLVLLAAAVGALTVTVTSLVRMLTPGTDALPSSLVGNLGHGVELALSLTGALAALLVSVSALATRDPANRAVPRWLLHTVGLVAGALLAVTMPGGVIAAAGYTFAMMVIVGTPALIILIVLRRPLVGLLLAAVVGGALAYAAIGLGAGPLVPQILGSYGMILPQAGLALAHVAAASGLLIWTIADPSSRRSRFARDVLRHRRAITIVAATCALPYAFARASWLTPWPLFGGSAEMFAADPSVRALGLALGAAMLTGGVLTLGLILPWGERFPRAFAGLGGRSVPPGLAIVPASLVSVLFTAAGVQFALEGVGTVENSVYVLLMFPFWLWGPLLGLATWAYSMHRATSTAAKRSDSPAARVTA
ncbi:MAG: hypothetical protein K0R99_146 [Microbacterium sp.]|jgi:hypothetical protein|uniref:hypothetical protein n=1 Tax=Microbacterium sp. TaxID=51671 RepID=UPI00260A2A5B|nr:hypothetical protein [Microbacterium sp.]MDF2558700.1 hypothetical protein [Microbacterium sp.]